MLHLAMPYVLSQLRGRKSAPQMTNVGQLYLRGVSDSLLVNANFC